MNFSEINRLFDKIAHTNEEKELRELESEIWLQWLSHPNPQVKFLFDKAVEELQKDDLANAIDTLNQVIEIAPNYAEAWNKRAVAYYMRGIYKKSIADIKKTLSIEPRHFGALGGLYSICITIGDLRGARKALQDLEKIYPKRADLKKHIGQLNLQISSKKE